MKTQPTQRTFRALAAAALAAGVLTAAGGCYQRVVSARGPGADRYNIEEPYQQDTKLDRWFYGERSGNGRTPLERRP